ncbi:uncharacterized protein [Porites lutea]|uniref:uncharacterized protein isoform X1 n=1 Tax=Porites lutea TaxID=51062 RepID=UPI003CC696AB
MELMNCRATCADLEEKLRESTRLIKDSTALVADNKQSINMLQEVVNKEQEKCNMLQEHISQSDATYSCAISSMQALRRENQEVVESLASLRRQMEEAQERPETSMQEERRRLRMEHDKFIEELLLAFNNTETDKVKVLKLKLSKEKEKRRRVEKRKKEISKEKEELKALVLRQGEIEGDSIALAAEACGGDSNGQNYELTDAESSSSASEFSSGEAEVNDPTQSLRGSSQHSDSGESSDEEPLFEDAKEYL